MDDDLALYILASSFSKNIVNGLLGIQHFEDSEAASKGIFKAIDFKKLEEMCSNLHTAALNVQNELFELPEGSGNYRALYFSFYDSLSLLLKIVNEKMFMFHNLNNQSEGQFFSFREYRKSIKLINKLYKKLSKNLLIFSKDLQIFESETFQEE